MSDTKSRAVPPGGKIRLELAKNHIKEDDFARELGLAPEEFQELLVEDLPLTPFIAAKLEYLLEIPAMTWINMENIYRKRLNLNSPET